MEAATPIGRYRIDFFDHQNGSKVTPYLMTPPRGKSVNCTSEAKAIKAAQTHISRLANELQALA